MMGPMRLEVLLVTIGALSLVGCGSGGDPAADAGPGADAAGPMITDEHPRIMLNHEPTRMRLAAAITAERPAAVRFVDMVDAEMAGTEHYAFEPWFAALVGALTGDSSYCAFAIARTDAFVAAEEALIAGGERPEAAFDSYLYVGEHVGNLARVLDWCFADVSDDQRERWLAYGNQAVWNVWHHEEAVWGGQSWPWSGWSVDNPSNNYYYSFLQATLLLGLAGYREHPDAPGWVTMFRDTKIAGQLVPAFTADLDGGGSREGSGYGVSMARLFHLYDTWETSTGEPIADLTSHTRASLVHFLHLVVPTLDRIAPTGDHARDSTAALFDYHRNYVQTLAWLYADDPVAPTARWWLGACSVPEMDQFFMMVWDFIYDGGDLPAATGSELHTSYRAAGTGQLYARSSWAEDATWVNLIGGPYTESHAHHDQGSFMLYRGEWLAYDQNVLSSSGIRQEEELHNLVRIAVGGTTVRQQEGAPQAQLLALAEDARYLYAAVDVTPIYDGDAAVSRVERELVFVKPDTLVVFDRIDAAAASQRVWQLNTPIAPVLSGAGDSIATLTGDQATLVVRRILPAGAVSSVLDWTGDAEMSGGYRIDATDTGGDGSSRFLHVLSVDGAVTAATPSDDGDQLGVALTVSGAPVTVRFAADEPGGSLIIDGDAITLAPGIQVLPELAP
jgi:hypothetical protein